MDLTTIVVILMFAIPIIFAITVHEAAHGYAAKYFGDMTAYKAGRITLNPFKHIDLFGTIILPILAIKFGGVLFGWAKPVPVNFGALNNPKKDMLWVAAAGPFSNLIQAIVWGALFGYATFSTSSTAKMLFEMSKVGISINVSLMVLNLIPLPPLDGGRIAVSALPNPWSNSLAQIERFGLPVLIAILLLVTHFDLLTPMTSAIQSMIKAAFV